jgi:hypothetical protein
MHGYAANTARRFRSVPSIALNPFLATDVSAIVQ